MNSAKQVWDRGAGKVEKKGRKMPYRGYSRSGGNAAVRTLDSKMIARYTDCSPLCDFSFWFKFILI